MCPISMRTLWPRGQTPVPTLCGGGERIPAGPWGVRWKMTERGGGGGQASLPPAELWEPPGARVSPGPDLALAPAQGTSETRGRWRDWFIEVTVP